jgi:hypothetical protein
MNKSELNSEGNTPICFRVRIKPLTVKLNCKQKIKLIDLHSEQQTNINLSVDTEIKSQNQAETLFVFISCHSPYLFYLLVHSRCRGCLFSLDHTQTHTTVGRIPLDERSARHRDLYLTTQTLYKTNIHARGGIRTRNSSKRSAADLRLRPRGHWDRRPVLYFR